MSAPPRRRWFQFSITSMLVIVTLFAVWLAWELKFIRDRQAWRDQHRNRVDFTLLPYRDNSLPWWRRWLGDLPTPSIVEERESTEDREHIKRLFPEAEFYWVFPPTEVPP